MVRLLAAVGALLASLSCASAQAPSMFLRCETDTTPPKPMGEYSAFTIAMREDGKGAFEGRLITSSVTKVAVGDVTEIAFFLAGTAITGVKEFDNNNIMGVFIDRVAGRGQLQVTVFNNDFSAPPKDIIKIGIMCKKIYGPAF